LSCKNANTETPELHSNCVIASVLTNAIQAMTLRNL